MVVSAADSFERGNFSVEQQFNKYRSIAPRQTINAVHTSGGYTAGIGERVALVLYSTLEALVQVSRQQATFSTMARLQQHSREYASASGLGRFLMGLATIKDGIHRFTCDLLTRVGKALESATDESILGFYSVAPQVKYRKIPAAVVLSKRWTASSKYAVDMLTEDFRDVVLRTAPADVIRAAPASAVVAEELIGRFGGYLDSAYKEKLEQTIEVAKPQQEAEVSAIRDVKQGLLSSVGSSTRVVGGKYVAVDAVRDAIEEAIQEVLLEGRNVEASCMKFRDECMRSGEPDLNMLVRKKEEMMQPDFWYVKHGTVVRSALGRDGADFSLSALLLPVSNAAGGFVFPVNTVLYAGRSRGQSVEREHFTIDNTSFEGWAFANESLAVYNGPEIVSALRLAMERVVPLHVTLRRDPAGGGKTTRIVNSVKVDEVVLCPAKASVDETRGRIRKFRSELSFPVHERCRTIDSYLVNVIKNRKVEAMRASVLRGDEAFMTRSGKWYACALLLRTDSLSLYGDPEQIPHVPRALCPRLHLSIKPSVVEFGWITYRCPRDALAAVGDLYEWKARSASKVERSLSLLDSPDIKSVSRGCVMLCMYQSEKTVLQKWYRDVNVPIRVMTVHEAQGNTFEHVRLHRYIRGKNRTDIPDAFDLFQKPNYVLVAMSRHTQSFGYWSEMGQDEVSRRIVQGSLQSRVNAAGDMKTAGSGLEHA